MIARAFCLALVLATPAFGQVVSPGLEQANPEMTTADRRAVQARVEEFLKKLGGRDLAGARAMLAPKVLIVIIRQQRDGSFANTYQTRDEFIAQLEKNASQPKFEEPLTNVTVTVDSGSLAYVRADFAIMRDGKAVSTGVDHFTLVKEADQWKVAVLAYTSLPATR
jgi:ketosteroid isomerase-like protein